MWMMVVAEWPASLISPASIRLQISCLSCFSLPTFSFPFLYVNLLKSELYVQRIVIQDPASWIRSIGSHVWWHDALQKGFAIASTIERRGGEGRGEKRRGEVGIDRSSSRCTTSYTIGRSGNGRTQLLELWQVSPPLSLCIHWTLCALASKVNKRETLFFFNNTNPIQP
jgi:hypothetical protein